MVTRAREALTDGNGGEFDDENPSKRPRIFDVQAAPVAPPCLLDLNDDCLVLMLSNLHYEDMNSAAMCCRRLRQVRGHESLDQSRSGTYVFSEGSLITTFYNAIDRLDEEFQGNRKTLKFVGLENLPREFDESYAEARSLNRPDYNPTLSGVTTVDLTQCPQASYMSVVYNVSRFPNLTELKMDGLLTPGDALYALISYHCPLLTKLSWQGCQDPFYLNRFLVNLVELYMDDSLFRVDTESLAYGCLFGRHTGLRLSIKNATIIIIPRHPQRIPETAVYQPISQDMLIDMVRRHPSLRWLRSDLTAGDVVMLQQERPDIVFVSD